MADLVKLFAALADPTRLRLLALIRNGEICVCHLQAVIQTNQPKISRHLAYLKKSGLVKSRREGKWMYYRLAFLKKPHESIFVQVLGALKDQPVTSQDAKDLRDVRNAKTSELPVRHLKKYGPAVALKR